MPVTITDTANVRAEKAIAAYIRGHRDSNADVSTFEGDINFDSTRIAPLLGVGVYEGRNTQRRTAPAISVICQKAVREWNDVAWYQGTVEITLYTHRHESASDVKLAEVLHLSRSKAINDLICDEDTLMSELNKPDAPTADTRAVDEFTVMGVMAAGTISGDVSDELFTELFELELWFCPFDTIV